MFSEVCSSLSVLALLAVVVHMWVLPVSTASVGYLLRVCMPVHAYLVTAMNISV